MFCQKCGAQIADDSLFCAVCGEKVSVQAQDTTQDENTLAHQQPVVSPNLMQSQPAAPPNSMPQPMIMPKKKSKLPIIIIGVIITGSGVYAANQIE